MNTNNNINWFPGHMAKAERIIKENITQVDLVIEMRDARIPVSSKNPDIERIVGSKPSLILFSKSSLSDPEVNKEWKVALEKEGKASLFIDIFSGEGIRSIRPVIDNMMKEKTDSMKSKGITKNLKAMIVGIPNVGKSSFINKMCGAKKTKVEDRPGVTLTKQWVKSSIGLDFLDMPGVLWPKFADDDTAFNLVFTGAIKDQIVDVEDAAVKLVGKLRNIYPDLLCARYKLDNAAFVPETTDYELFSLIAKKRGMILSGNEIDDRRCANMLLDEFRSAKIGRISLERPQW